MRRCSAGDTAAGRGLAACWVRPVRQSTGSLRFPGGGWRRKGWWAETSKQDSCLGYRKVTALLHSNHGQTISPKRVARNLPARRVIDCLEELVVTTGREPEWLRSDNGPEFVAARVQAWIKEAGVGSAYIKPGSPWENGHVESFHASLRAEFLDRELFFSPKDVTVMLEDWRYHYNHERPHGSLSNKTPVQKSTIAKSIRTTKIDLQNSH